MEYERKTSAGNVAARREVELAKADLLDRMRVATAVSTQLAQRAIDGAKPVIAALLTLGVLALGVGLYALTRGRRRANGWRSPPRRSLLADMLHAALVSASSRVAAMAVLRVQRRQLEAANPEATRSPH